VFTFIRRAPSRLALLLCAAGALPSTTHAHVVLAEPSAAAGSSYRATFKVGHGCDGSPITELIVRLPLGVKAAKPMPKPGWTVERRIDKLATPYTLHARTVTEDVREIRWKGGPLPDGFYDEFVVQLQVPEQSGPQWFAVTQVCEQGRIDWAEVPSEGTSTRGLKAPAALLQVLPAEHGHAH
jgi:uncharacterized protein YcnI